MNIQKHLPTFSRWFSRNPKQSVLPLQTADNTTTGPAYSFVLSQAKETPRKRCAYIPESESPWVVIVYNNRRWEFNCAHITRKEARAQRSALIKFGMRSRVVRPLIPTR